MAGSFIRRLLHLEKKGKGVSEDTDLSDRGIADRMGVLEDGSSPIPTWLVDKKPTERSTEETTSDPNAQQQPPSSDRNVVGRDRNVTGRKYFERFRVREQQHGHRRVRRAPANLVGYGVTAGILILYLWLRSC